MPFRSITSPIGRTATAHPVDGHYKIVDNGGEILGWMRPGRNGSKRVWGISLAMPQLDDFTGKYVDMGHALDGILFKREQAAPQALIEADLATLRSLYNRSKGQPWEPKLGFSDPRFKPRYEQWEAAGYVRKGDGRCGFEAMKDVYVVWTDAAHQAFGQQEQGQ